MDTKNDKSLGAGVQSGLSSRQPITENEKSLGLDSTGKDQKPLGGGPIKGSINKGGKLV
jgi:hypothetical protein